MRWRSYWPWRLRWPRWPWTWQAGAVIVAASFVAAFIVGLVIADGRAADRLTLQQDAQAATTRQLAELTDHIRGLENEKAALVAEGQKAKDQATASVEQLQQAGEQPIVVSPNVVPGAEDRVTTTTTQPPAPIVVPVPVPPASPTTTEPPTTTAPPTTSTTTTTEPPPPSSTTTTTTEPPTTSTTTAPPPETTTTTTLVGP